MKRDELISLLGVADALSDCGIDIKAVAVIDPPGLCVKTIGKRFYGYNVLCRGCANSHYTFFPTLIGAIRCALSQLEYKIMWS